MKLETDLDKIKSIAERKEEENRRFRSFLKNNESQEGIDRIVHDLCRRISSEIDCKQCGNCCREMTPVLSQKDIRDFSLGLSLDIEKFQEQYLIEDETPGKFQFNNLPCPFLKGNLCINYEHRPQDCQSFPHLHKRDFTSRLFEVLENYSICLVVFNVYEYLKKEFWQ